MLSTEILHAGNGLATSIKNQVLKIQHLSKILEIQLSILRRKILNSVA